MILFRRCHSEKNGSFLLIKRTFVLYIKNGLCYNVYIGFWYLNMLTLGERINVYIRRRNTYGKEK